MVGPTRPARLREALRPPEVAVRASTVEAPAPPERLQALPPPASLPKPQRPEGLLQRMVALASGRRPAVAAALAGASLFGALVGAPLAAQAAPPDTTAAVEDSARVPLAESILNPRGAGNPSGASGMFQGSRVGARDPRVPQIDGRTVSDPDRVMTQNTWDSGAAEIRRILQTREGAPRTAEVVAAKLAELYGPFTAANSEENRQAIIANLRWIADTQTGVRYDHGRAGSSDATTQAPNATLSQLSGVCRDIHVATSAILASLMNARLEGGVWVPGAPTGQEANVQTVGFATPAEHHAYMVYRDPATGGWSALEYGKSYALNATNALDAFRALPGHADGYHRYVITGWSSKPVVSDYGSLGAAAARAFLRDNPGIGAPGEVRISGGEDRARLTAFVTPSLSIAGEIAEGGGAGVEGGVKVNYHTDFETLDRQGWVRIAGGVYSSAFEASQFTGQRGRDGRVAYRTHVVALQVDGRRESLPAELIGEHLRWKWGIDMDALVGVPFSEGRMIHGSVTDFTSANLGADGTLLGRERLSPRLTLDWAVRARFDADLVETASQLVTSGGRSAAGLGVEALRTDVAVALTHQSEGGLTTRIEAGGSQWLAKPFDPQTDPAGTHYAVLGVEPKSGQVSFGILARGGQLDGRFVPVDGLGVAVALRPAKNVELGLQADTVFPGGEARRFGENVQVRGNLRIRF